MNNSTWKYLRNEFCSVKKWVADDQQTHCHYCNKEFLFLVRRKHHCRSCGKIFCDPCSNYWINGRYVDESLERRLRLCQYCHIKILEYVGDMTRRHYYKENKEGVGRIRADSEEEEDAVLEENENQGFDLNELFEVPKEEPNHELSEMLLKCAEYLCQNNGITEKRWAMMLSSMAEKAAKQTKIDTLYQNQNIDITQYVKIKQILTDQSALSRAFKGYVTTKNVVSKHMRTSFINPRVVLITPAIELPANFVESLKFEQIANREKAYLKKVTEKLLKYNPDIIFVQNTVNILALEILQEKGVTVVTKLKPIEVDSIRKITKIRKKIEKLQNFHKMLPEHVVGTCRRIYFQAFQNNGQSTVEMFLEDEESPLMSIILADTDVDKLECLKKIEHRLLQAARQLLLEGYLIQTEMTHFKIKQQHSIFNDYFFNDSAEQFLRKKRVNTAKLVFVKSKFSNILDVGKQSILDTYFKKRPYSFEWPFEDQSDLCLRPEYKSQKFYSKESTVDIPLGIYIVLKVGGLDRKCQSCGRPKYNHSTALYFNGCLIRISASEGKYHRVITNIVDESQEQEPNASIVMASEKIQMKLKQKVKSTLHYKQKVSCYLQCADCQMCLTDNIQLKRQYLQNSFLYFIFKMSTRVRHLRKESTLTQGSRCRHNTIARVFVYDEIHVKFVARPVEVFELNEVDFSTAESASYIESRENMHLEALTTSEIKPVYSACEELLDYLTTSSILYFGDVKRMSIKQTMNYEYLTRIKEILEKLLEDMRKAYTFVTSQFIYGFDYTVSIKQFHEFYAIFDSILKITVELDLKVRKVAKKEKQQAHEDEVIPDRQERDSRLFMEILDGSTSISGMVENTKSEDSTNLNAIRLPDRFSEIRRGISQQNFIVGYTPIYKEDPISFISFALNTTNFSTVKENEHKEIKIRISMAALTMPECSLKRSIEELRQQLKIQTKLKDYSDYIFQVTVYNHFEFQKIRQEEGLNFPQFVKSLMSCISWDTAGGKRGRFAKAFNEMIVVKYINDNEFEEFRKFAVSYIKHTLEAKKTKINTLLAKIFGIFKVSLRGQTHNCIVMQNLFYQVDQAKMIVYDLKGSETNRFAEPKEGKGFTGLDTNFKIDRNSQPICLDVETYDRINKMLEEDCKFLSNVEVIDYSLLLIINQDRMLFRIGIIDFMRPYHLIEVLENFYKQMKFGGQKPTVIPPHEYKDRFLESMKHYFIKISSD